MIVLDVGCGHNKKHMKRGVIGIDLQKGLCDIQANAVMLPFKNGFFDQVNCYHCLEHIIKFGKVIKEMRRVLKKGGKIVIEVPNPACFWIFKDYIKSRKAKLGGLGCCSEHICCWGESEIQNLMRENLLEVISIKYVLTMGQIRLMHKKGYSILKRIFYKAFFTFFPAFRNGIRVETRKP